MTELPALIGEATKKSDLIWLAGPDREPTAAWHLWLDDADRTAAYTVTGPGEQPLPGIVGSPTCAVTVRSKANWGRIVTWEASVGVVEPHSAEWEAVVPALLLKRLNLPDFAVAGDRWARECTVVRLAPTGRLLEAGADLPDASGATPPRPTPATTSVRVPYTLGRHSRRVGR